MIGIHQKPGASFAKKKKMPSNQETTIKTHKLVISTLSIYTVQARENERVVSRKAEITN